MQIEAKLKELMGEDSDKLGALSDLITNYTQEEVSGLKAKVDQLLAETKTAKERAEEAARERAAAELDAMKKSGDIKAIEERLKRDFEEQIGKLQETIKQKDQHILGSAKQAIISEAASLAVNDDAKPLMMRLLESMISTSYDDQHQVTMTYADLSGKAIGTSKESLIDHLKSSPSFAPLVKSGAGTGAGGTGGHSGNGIPKKKPEDYSAAELAEIRKTDQSLFDSIIKAKQDAYQAKIGQVL